ncbi:pollen-specific leucine-rich repeat extensin-like protein 3 [Gymnodraco acuticeps]|uniref:Pollen-specific leucine-rich repeat extensin-like protein 3 n=1 Tax=Gymnodraco acuticeps TaxID=8218 RepID=A0A6P8UTE1_GYMAC|nr:pollen-specific leucine-rich repeat extensin-like protein 3 [Gymnodraco acuticeps]
MAEPTQHTLKYVSQWRRRNLRFLRVHRGEFLRGDVSRCVPAGYPPPQDPITETPLPNVIQETEPPSSLPSSPPPLLISFPPLRGPSDLHRPPPSPP